MIWAAIMMGSHSVCIENIMIVDAYALFRVNVLGKQFKSVPIRITDVYAMFKLKDSGDNTKNSSPPTCAGNYKDRSN